MSGGGETYEFRIGEEQAEERLDKFLATELAPASLSRERIQTLIDECAVSRNGKPVTKASQRLKEGDALSVLVPEARPIALTPEAIPLDVVYEDDWLLVVNKPAGMLTHPSGAEQSGTLVNALLHHCGESLSGINGLIRPGIVHRLDRDTAGLLMVAKTDAAHHHLSAQLKAKTARREYAAIAQGRFPEASGTIDAPIGRNPKHRDKMAVIPDGRPAVTHWEVTERIGDKFALLRLRLETGRTHQIRVHLSNIAHPILGDALYGSGLEKNLALKIRGQLLQAVRLAFAHPKDEQPMAFEIPLNKTMTAAWAWLQRDWT